MSNDWCVANRWIEFWLEVATYIYRGCIHWFLFKSGCCQVLIIKFKNDQNHRWLIGGSVAHLPFRNPFLEPTVLDYYWLPPVGFVCSASSNCLNAYCCIIWVSFSLLISSSSSISIFCTAASWFKRSYSSLAIFSCIYYLAFIFLSNNSFCFFCLASAC